ncbi:hypothetical protein [Pseudomonas sp. SWRI179]|uniref:hypothetical protein n=1 Tax=Pseudomonas sp. SWRI179 TaxID=2745497 RepID=UPI001647CEFC|nr:hypothetical protein [Pseudomonas sp. SWRI179]MBC3387483.1 hypothetical protein [Pseudomonas sp. SWRI179]
MCEKYFRIVYYLFLRKGWRRISILESCISYSDGAEVFSEDLLRNEFMTYEKIFSSECEGYVLDLFRKFMSELGEVRLEDSGEVLDVLELMQSICATALWKFNCELPPEMDYFVREFDRLDDPEEKERLYMSAQ